MADIVKITLNTGKTIEAQQDAFDIAGDINNGNVMVKIGDGDYIPANIILRIQTFRELGVEVEAKNDKEVDKKE